MMSTYMANRLVKDTPRSEIIHVPWGGDTKDIIRVIMEVANERDIESQVADFAQKFKARNTRDQYELIHELWAFCRRRIEYVADGWEEQKIQHPRRVYHSRKGDCKSLTLFVYACLSAIGIPCFIRFASYWDEAAVKQAKRNGQEVRVGQIGHVYPVAIIDGRTVPVDVCLEQFDAEQKAVRVLDKFTNAWSHIEIKSLAKQSQTAAIGSVGSAGTPQWVKFGLAFLGLAGAVNGKGIVRYVSGAVGGYYLYSALKPYTLPTR